MNHGTLPISASVGRAPVGGKDFPDCQRVFGGCRHSGTIFDAKHKVAVAYAISSPTADESQTLPRRNGTLGQKNLSPIAKSLQALLAE